MVSTDAAARGIDIPNVTHVIQADFAASAVDFLHRVGLHVCRLFDVRFAASERCQSDVVQSLVSRVSHKTLLL